MCTAKKMETDATQKLTELLHCGNERVELSAAKEILARLEEEKEPETSAKDHFTVEIRVVGGDDGNG